jgi:ribosomal protein S27E
MEFKLHTSDGLARRGTLSLAHGTVETPALTIFRYLDCGCLQNGFARVKCNDCGHEYLVAFSCKRRHFCPSCHHSNLQSR